VQLAKYLWKRRVFEEKLVENNEIQILYQMFFASPTVLEVIKQYEILAMSSRNW
jgi:hypothetical protein